MDAGLKCAPNLASASHCSASSGLRPQPFRDLERSNKNSGKRREPSTVSSMAPTRRGYCRCPFLVHSHRSLKDLEPKSPSASVRNVRSTTGGSPRTRAASLSSLAASRCDSRISSAEILSAPPATSSPTPLRSPIAQSSSESAGESLVRSFVGSTSNDPKARLCPVVP